MKKILFSVAAVMAFGYASAQEEVKAFGFGKGDIFVEGSLNFNSTKDNNSDEKTNNFNFTPKAGYFVTDKIAVGVQLGVGSGKKEDAAGEVKTNSFSAGVFGRYYFLELGQRFKTYTELGVGYASVGGKVSPTGLPSTDLDDTNEINFGLGLGMNYFITPQIAISFGLSDILSYKSYKTDADNAKSVNEFNGNLNVFKNFFDTPTFGMLYKF